MSNKKSRKICTDYTIPAQHACKNSCKIVDICMTVRQYVLTEHFHCIRAVLRLYNLW